MDILTLIGLLGLLEVFFIVAAVAVTMILKLRGARREMADLRQQLEKAPVVATHVSKPAAAVAKPSTQALEYADYLREQLARSSVLLGEDVQPDSTQAATPVDAETQSRHMLAARHQFLQLELDQQHYQNDEPQQQRRHLVDGMQALLDAMDWQQSTPSDIDAPTDVSADTQLTVRSEVIRLEEQITSLRRVIDNQHDSMRDLRQLLETAGGDSDELQAVLKKLSNAETQAVELYRCMEVVEGENDRLKSSPQKTHVEGGAASKDTDTLRDLVDDQKRTIGALQELLRDVATGGTKSSELDAAFNKIQRTNNELNSCILLLEEENDLLRTKSEDLQACLDQQEVVAATAASVIASAPALDAESAAAENAHETEAVPEPESPPVVEDDADFDIDSLIESNAAPAVTEPAAAEEVVATKAEPESPPAVEDDADFDIDALLESTAKPVPPPVAAEMLQAADDIDSLLENFGQAVTPAMPQRTEKPAPAEDDTDALLAELFGTKPKSPS